MGLYLSSYSCTVAGAGFRLAPKNVGHFIPTKRISMIQQNSLVPWKMRRAEAYILKQCLAVLGFWLSEVPYIPAMSLSHEEALTTRGLVRSSESLLGQKDK